MKILHASDFHLDSPFQRLSAEQAMIRRRELRELPLALVQLAQAEQTDLILLPGDLFDGERVYPETVQTLTSALGSVSIPVVIAPGNHDCADGCSPYLTASWPENVHIFTRPEMTSFSFPELGCTVHGCAFTSPHCANEPLAGFTAPDDGRLHLLCLHGEVGLSGHYAPISPASLSRSAAAYAALGHIHQSSGLHWEGDTAWAYCGCPEGRGFDECGPKGALIVTIDDGGISAQFKSLCRRMYRIEHVNLSSFDQSIAAIPREDLVRIILSGESDRSPDTAALLERLKARFFYAELRDETTLPQDLWAKAEEDNLTGLFLREMRHRLDHADKDQRAAVLLATRFGLAALDGGEDICP